MKIEFRDHPTPPDDKGGYLILEAGQGDANDETKATQNDYPTLTQLENKIFVLPKLPDDSIKGKYFYFIGKGTITGSGADTIDGRATLELPTKNSAVVLVAPINPKSFDWILFSKSFHE